MISPLAHIHSAARLGENVKVDAFAIIEEDVEIGEGTHVMANACVLSGSRIGKNCKLFPGAVVGGMPQDLGYKGEKTTCEIGDNTVLREYVTVNRGTPKDKGITRVGSNCLIMAYCHVAHDCVVGNHVVMANSVQLAGHVIIDDYARLGGLAGVHQFIHIGSYTYIAGQILIRKDVPPFVKAARDPLSFVGVNVVGLERSGFSKEAIRQVQEMYHVLFVQGHPTSKAIEIIESTITDSDVKKQIVSFVKNSATGIIKRHKDTTVDDFAI
ncbi:MAG: lpxA [Chitinophagaceae bacterium]|nr:lpxA [Chitinophagaceae bacterium]